MNANDNDRVDTVINMVCAMMHDVDIIDVVEMPDRIRIILIHNDAEHVVEYIDRP